MYEWSIEKPDKFWESIWIFCNVIYKKTYILPLENFNSFEDVKWFPGSYLNYTENLLRKNNNDYAIIFKGENKFSRKITFKELNEKISCMQQYFKNIGVKKGERIAFYLPNIPESIICVLAAASIGAVSSMCSPDFGIEAVLDRFGQIEPKVFICTDGYLYNQKIIYIEDKVKKITKNLSSLKNIIFIPYVADVHENKSKDLYNENLYEINYFEIINKIKPQLIEYEYVPFDHPLYIMFSSGTTGVPKCIVHGVGGTLIQHLKEHKLHCNIKENDKIFYYTTCGWMMWQWLIGALGCNATILLYDGSPFSPNKEVLFDYLEEEQATFFGTSAKFIDSLKKINFNIKNKYNLESLKIIGSTGSPLLPESFDYVYENIKSNVCLSSLSGGTDIISCFVLGNPIGKVYRGEIQTRGLGMGVCIFDDEGNSIVNKKGELVCKIPFPSMPIYFWNDPERKKYNSSYFNKYKNVWHHGDWAELTENGGIIIYGRSDATLNPGGIRIGTAEIYRQVEQFEEVIESVVVEQFWNKESRIILFLVMREGCCLNQQLKENINFKLKTSCSYRHVPAKIIEVADIPKTKSGKIMELAVKHVINKLEVRNKESMANPEALTYFQNLTEIYMD